MTSLALRYSKCTALPPDTGAGLKYTALPAGSPLSKITQNVCVSLFRHKLWFGPGSKNVTCFNIFENDTFFILLSVESTSEKCLKR